MHHLAVSSPGPRAARAAQPTRQPSQEQQFYAASRAVAETNLLFLDLVKDGLTRKELERNIERRPQLWGRFRSWLEVLP